MKRVSYNGYYVAFPRLRRGFDSLHPHQRLTFVAFSDIIFFMSSYESTDPERYQHALDLVELFENLPEDKQSAVDKRAWEIQFDEELGAVEAIAQAMTEAGFASRTQDQSPNTE